MGHLQPDQAAQSPDQYEPEYFSTILVLLFTDAKFTENVIFAHAHTQVHKERCNAGHVQHLQPYLQSKPLNYQCRF